MSELIVCGTGHRPDKLIGEYENWKEHQYQLIEFAEIVIEEYNPDVVISGMALGWDLCLAQAAINKFKRLEAALPCRNQTVGWKPDDIRWHQEILKLAAKTTVISEGYTNWCMHKRNEFMVDESQMILALWDGSDGGTSNCVKYAKKKNKKVVNLWKTYLDLYS